MAIAYLVRRFDFQLYHTTEKDMQWDDMVVPQFHGEFQVWFFLPLSLFFAGAIPFLSFRPFRDEAGCLYVVLLPAGFWDLAAEFG